jgi:acyl dehydratase
MRPVVDSTDWLKTAAIMLVAIDHFGYFFLESESWWTVIGRFAAPPFFFLLGYARTVRVPLTWVWLAILLTVLDSANNDWTWVAPNIFLSFVLIRLARPRVQTLLVAHGWVTLAMFIAILLALAPVTGRMVDYGAAGWLWALAGICQRIHVDQRFAVEPGSGVRNREQSAGRAATITSPMRVLACLSAAVVYTWQEQLEFSFSGVSLTGLVAGMCLLTAWLYLFRRGPSRIQPPAALAAVLTFCGQHTLGIYAIQLAGSEILVLLLPDLA